MTDSQRPDDGDDLRDRFAELRRRDDGSAPDFDRTWEAARVESRRVSSSKRRRTALLAGGALAAAAALLLLIVRGPGPSNDGMAGAAPARPAPPLDFLLERPVYAAVDLEVDAFRYRLDEVLEDAQSGVEQ